MRIDPDRERLLRPYLDGVAARFLAQTKGRRFNIKVALRVLRDVIRRDHGLVSFKHRFDDELILGAYFDQHEQFERVSEAAEWEPRTKMIEQSDRHFTR
jgi:hypothetical protein